MKYIVSLFSVFLFGVISSPAMANLEPGINKTFVVSAYYSPLPNQTAYVRGSYDADRVLNGNGIAGADGTAVKPGMLAAPKSYPFGTKIYIPGLGKGTVHDRGGVILAYENYDRIDVWMGYGDEGRIRALNWGMRKIEGKIMEPSTPDTIDFPNITPPAGIYKTGSSSVGKSLWKGSKGDSVKELQNFLASEGFFYGAATGFFGERTKTAVVEFQKTYSIISSEKSVGAGVYGPKTRAKLGKITEKKDSLKPYETQTDVFSFALKRGEKSEAVKRLQFLLASLGYFTVEPNGVFGPKTEQSILEFQLDKNIISSPAQKNAGVFDKKTQVLLKRLVLEKRKIFSGKESSEKDFVSAEIMALRHTKIELQKYVVQYGERGETVRKLQQELIARGFLEKGLDTGFYGKKTAAALEEYKEFIG